MKSQNSKGGNTPFCQCLDCWDGRLQWKANQQTTTMKDLRYGVYVQVWIHGIFMQTQSKLHALFSYQDFVRVFPSARNIYMLSSTLLIYSSLWGRIYSLF